MKQYLRDSARRGINVNQEIKRKRWTAVIGGDERMQCFVRDGMKAEAELVEPDLP